MKPRRLLTKTLLLTAGLVLIATLGVWTTTGAHTGWTLTRVTEMKTDEFTGIEYPVEKDGFVAGVDFLALGGGLAIALAGAGFVTTRWSQRHS